MAAAFIAQTLTAADLISNSKLRCVQYTVVPSFLGSNIHCVLYAGIYGNIEVYNVTGGNASDRQKEVIAEFSQSVLAFQLTPQSCTTNKWLQI